MANKQSISLLAIQFLLVILLVFYLLSRNKGVPVFLFWPILWTIVIFAVLGYKKPENFKITQLIILEIVLILIPTVTLPEIFHTGRDAIFESQFASIIIRENRWDPLLGTGFAENYYGYNPVLHFVLAFLSLTTGLNTYFLSKYIYILILRVVIVLATYLLISTIIDKKNNNVAYLATIVFMASPRLTYMGISRRLIAAVFMLLTIYAIFKGQDSSKRIWLMLYCIFSSMIVLSDHSISYLFMLFITTALIVAILTKSFIYFDFLKKYKLIIPNLFTKFIFYLGVWILWNIVISKLFMKVDLSYILEVTRFAVTGQGIHSVFGINLESPLSVHINYLYENVLIYASQLIFLMLCIIGLAFFLKYLNAKKESKFKIVPNAYVSLFLYYGLFGVVMYILAGFLMRTSLSVVPQSFIWFFSLPISIFVAYAFYILKKRSFNRSFSSIVILLTILLLTTGGLLMSQPPTILNRRPNEDIVLEFVDSKNQQLYCSGLWLKNNAIADSSVLGDTSVSDIYSGFFEFSVITGGYARDFYLLKNSEEINFFLQGTYLFGYYPHTKKSYTIDYVAINNQIFRYPSFAFGDPLDPTIKRNFDEANLNKIYDNQEIQIYHNYDK